MRDPEVRSARTESASSEIGRLRAVLEIGAVLVSIVVAGLLLGPLLDFPYVALVLYGGVVAAWCLLRLGGGGWRGLGLRRPESSLRTVAVALATAGAGLGLFLGVRALEPAGLPPFNLSVLRDAVRGDPKTYVATLLIVVWGTAAFGEELLFRGFVQDRFEALVRGATGATAWAVGLQAALFSLAHAYQGPTGILYSGLVGILLGAVSRRRGRDLWAVILAHGVVDTVAVTGLYLGWL